MLAQAGADESLSRPVQFLKGVGPKRAELLGRLGVVTVRDLLQYYPRTWEDRKETPRSAAGGLSAETIVFRGRVVGARAVRTRSRLEIFKAVLQVPAWGAAVDVAWFKRGSYRYDVFQKLRREVRPGADLWIVGRCDPSLLPSRDIRVEEYYPLDDPRAQLHVGGIVPVYALTEGLSQTFLRELMAQALKAAEHMPDVPPRVLFEKRRLLAAPQALRGIHFPKSQAELLEARRRLAYEELLLLELAWTLKKRQTREIPKNYGYALRRSLLTPFRERLGFELTRAQKRAVNEIFSDMQSPHPMTRLLQGDVGSGKTVVAMAALLLAVESGHQGAFMAPTEILAEQHYWTFSRILDGLPVSVGLLTSRTPAAERRRAVESLRDGRTHILIGTHALLEENVEFPRLRLAVIDEQHRFGVRQRATLRGKGPPLDLLVMTATPIPRTLALALYGDLDVSTLDEMPPGRSPVATRRGTEDQALEAVLAQAAEGRQAFVVYPIISESSRLELKAARSEYERLKAGALRGLRVALIHGQMRGRQKAAVMEGFARREWDVLVATPVIEVGIDVPNATVMVVQNAERFGLASLHQLRGRVNRGEHPAQCWLVGDPRTPEAGRRIDVLCETSDGFRIAEEDLKLRGPGEILGTVQHGELELKIADPVSDAPILAEARDDARELLAADPKLLNAAHKALRERLLDLYQRRWHMVDLA